MQHVQNACGFILLCFGKRRVGSATLKHCCLCWGKRRMDAFLGCLAFCPSNTKAKRQQSARQQIPHKQKNPPHYNRFVLLVCLLCLLVCVCAVIKLVLPSCWSLFWGFYYVVAGGFLFFVLFPFSLSNFSWVGGPLTASRSPFSLP